MNTEQNQNLNTAGTAEGVTTTPQVVSNDIAGQPTTQTGVTPVVNQVTNPVQSGPDPAIARYRQEAEAANAKLADPEVQAFLAQREAAKQAAAAEQLGATPEMYKHMQTLEANQQAMMAADAERQAQAGFQSFASTNGMNAGTQQEFIGYLEKSMSPELQAAALRPGFNFEPFMHGFAASKGLNASQAPAQVAQPVLVPGHSNGSTGTSTEATLLQQRIQDVIKKG